MMKVAVMEKKSFVKSLRNSMIVSILQLKKISSLEIKVAAFTHRNQQQLKRNGVATVKKKNAEIFVVAIVRNMKSVKKENDGSCNQKMKANHDDLIS